MNYTKNVIIVVVSKNLRVSAEVLSHPYSIEVFQDVLLELWSSTDAMMAFTTASTSSMSVVLRWHFFLDKHSCSSA